MKKENRRLQDVVLDILKEYPETRNDDFLLIDNVYFEVAKIGEIGTDPSDPWTYGVNVEKWTMSFHDLCVYHWDFEMPSFESITRIRRKLQRKYPELRAEKKVEEARAEQEKFIREYSKS